MNKIKLLPIIGLSTVGATTIPLVCCVCSCSIYKACVLIDKEFVSKHFGEQFTKDDIVVTLYNADGSEKTAIYGEDYKIFEGDNEITLPCSFTDKTLIGKSINYKIKIVKDESLTANLAINVLNKVATLDYSDGSFKNCTFKDKQEKVSVLNDTILVTMAITPVKGVYCVEAWYNGAKLASSELLAPEAGEFTKYELTVHTKDWYSIPNDATIKLHVKQFT